MAKTETFNTGALTAHLGITVTTALLTELGFKPVEQVKRASLWAISDMPAMCKAIGKHIASKADEDFDANPEKKPTKPATKTVAKSSPPPVDDDDDL